MAQMQNEIDDLGNLFEFGDIDLNPLPNVGNEQYGDEMQQSQHISHPTTPYNAIEQHPPPQQGTSAQDFGRHEHHYGMDQAMDQQQQYMSQEVPTTLPFTSESMYQPSIRQAYHHQHPQAYQYQQPQQQQQGFPQSHGVPPTPNSFEMHGEAGRFMQQQSQHMDPQQRALLEQRFQLRKDDAVSKRSDGLIGILS